MEPKLMTREANRELQKQEQVEQEKMRLRIRLVPIWLRIILVVFLVIAAFAVGSMIGYGVIGEGKPMDIMKKETWTYIVDLVNSES